MFGCRKEEIGLANDEASIEILNIVFFYIADASRLVKAGSMDIECVVQFYKMLFCDNCKK